MEIQKIENNTQPEYFEDSMTTLARETKAKKTAVKSKVKKQFISYGGMLIGSAIVVIVIAVMSTNITMITQPDIAALGLQWFIMCFCTYAVYVSWSDSGMRAGLKSPEYLDAINRYKDLYAQAKDTKAVAYAQKFCDHYIRQELLATREAILTEAGISLEEYAQKYQMYGEDEIRAMNLPKRAAEAIIKANRLQPIELTPPMFTRRGKISNQRMPIGTNPAIKKRRKYMVKLATVFGLSAFVTMIMAEAIVEFNWAVLAYIAIRLIFVIYNGYSGYVYGYDNVVTDAVNYTNDQSDLLQQLLQYVEEQRNEEYRSNHTGESAKTELPAGHDQGSLADPAGQRDSGDDGTADPGEQIPGGSGTADAEGTRTDISSVPDSTN